MTIIPEKSLLQHIAILGKSGSGKTYTAKGAAEQLLARGERVCIVDPTGVWWGLRSKGDGKKSAFPIVIFGGAHQDVALNPTAGAAIAEIVGTTDTCAILDTRQMGVGERTRFFTDFAETLLQKNRGPLHLIIDEAHVFAPQGRVADPQSGKMLHAANNLVSLGRGVGLRIILISQRPQKLHKDSLTQAETLIALRLIAPQDRRAVEEWIGEWADPKQGKELLQSLPSLPTGEGWIWAPEQSVLKRAKFPKITTYDSSSAPDGKNTNVVLANIDLPAIQQRLETVAKEAVENDPKRLRAKIAEMERAAKKSVPAAPSVLALEEAEEKGYDQGFSDGHQAGYDLAIKRLEEARNTYNATKKPKNVTLPTKLATKTPKPATSRPVYAASGPGEKMATGERKILIALAQYPVGRSKRQVGMLAGYAINGGGFNNYLSGLRTKGWIDGRGEDLRITDAGRAALGSFEPLPAGDELRTYWLGQLDKAPRAILQTLTETYPDALTKEQVAAAAGYEPNGGGFNNALSRLRTLELIEGRGELRASDDLFQEAA